MIEEQPNTIETGPKTPLRNLEENLSQQQVTEVEQLVQQLSSKPKKQRKKSNIKGNTAEKSATIEATTTNQTIENTEIVAPPLNPEIVAFKNNVKTYIQEMKTLLSEGLEQYTMTISPEFQEKIKEELETAEDEEKLKTLLERILAPIIDSKPFNNLSEIIVSCKEHVSALTNKFESWDIEKFKDFIMSVFERKNYLDRMKVMFTPEEINNHQFYIFEIKNVDNLTFFADMVEVNNARRKRAHKMKIVEGLYRLIKSIENAKSNEDLEKINKSLDSYYKKKQEKLKLLENKPNPSEKKRRAPANKEKDSIESKDGTSVNKTLKKLKLDSDKESFITGKDAISDSEQNEKKIVEESAKEAQEQENEKSKTKKTNNQKSLFSFFAKKSPRKSDVKVLPPKEKEEKKPLFRCVGSSNITNQTKSIVLQEVAPTGFNPAELLSNLKAETSRIKKLQRRKNCSKKFRKLYLFMWDSLKKYNGVICDLVGSRVRGRAPLQKEDCINYEVDSDEEYEEQNATDISISHDEKEIDEEDENDSEDEDEKFVVPDGYLSQEEKLDEDGDPEINRAILVTQQNANIQSNKAFLFSLEGYQKGKDSNLDEFIENFKAFQICCEEMPIAVKKHKNNEINAKGEELWNNEEIMKVFLRVLHGSYDTKPAIITDIFTKFPNLTKASIERKIKETSKKEKLEGQSRARYFVNREIFELWKIDQEYDLILKEKFELNAKKELELKKEQELKKAQQLQLEENKEDVSQKKGKTLIEEGKVENPQHNNIILTGNTEKKAKKTTPKKKQENQTTAGNSSNSKGQQNITTFLKNIKKE